MRPLIIIAAAAVALAGCRNNDQHDNTANVDENLTAENIVSNDVTAIDAVTGDAANMAADVPVDNSLGNGADELLNAPSAAKKPAHKSAAPPAGNKLANSTANAV